MRRKSRERDSGGEGEGGIEKCKVRIADWEGTLERNKNGRRVPPMEWLSGGAPGLAGEAERRRGGDEGDVGYPGGAWGDDFNADARAAGPVVGCVGARIEPQEQATDDEGRQRDGQ